MPEHGKLHNFELLAHLGKVDTYWLHFEWLLTLAESSLDVHPHSPAPWPDEQKVLDCPERLVKEALGLYHRQ